LEKVRFTSLLQKRDVAKAESITVDDAGVMQKQQRVGARFYSAASAVDISVGTGAVQPSIGQQRSGDAQERSGAQRLPQSKTSIERRQDGSRFRAACEHTRSAQQRSCDRDYRSEEAQQLSVIVASIRQPPSAIRK